MSSPPAWLQREQTSKQQRNARFLGQFAEGNTFRYEPRPLTPANPKADPPVLEVPHPNFGQTATVIRPPRLDVRSPSVRVRLADGKALSVRPSSLKRIESDPFIRERTPDAPPQPPGRDGQPLDYPETPPEPVTAPALRRISQEARGEINRIAQAIHRRHFVSAQSVLPQSEKPSQPRADKNAATISEHWLGSYSDALEACRMLSVGRWEEAGHYASLSLAKQARYRHASKAFEATKTRLSTGRYFNGELLSVRHHHPCDDPRMHAAFEQWYIRLVLTWNQDGATLNVANAAQLEGETGIIVGPDGWNDLVRWVTELTEVLDGQRRGRRLDDDRDLIYLWREDTESYLLRRRLHAKYPGLPRAFECLRRVMHGLRVLDRGELPEDRPEIGYHPPELREGFTDDGIGDDELEATG